MRRFIFCRIRLEHTLFNFKAPNIVKQCREIVLYLLSPLSRYPHRYYAPHTGSPVAPKNSRCLTCFPTRFPEVRTRGNHWHRRPFPSRDVLAPGNELRIQGRQHARVRDESKSLGALVSNQLRMGRLSLPQR